MDHSLIGALSASRAAAQIRAGTLSCEELMLSCLARIAQREPQVGAWQFLDATRALERARAADKLAPQGPLHGIPVGIKDIIDTVDMPTTLGSQIYAKRQPQWDAACVAALRAAGAIVLGKTVSTEFAYFQPGKTRHPHDLLHTPGGSSSGSAAAVADFMVPVALGSQTAASVTRPAAFCGVYGYKASHGEFSLSGIRPFAESLDSLGVLARSVDDIVLMRSVLLGGIPIDHRPLAAPPRLAVCRTAQWSQAEPQAQNALETVVQACRKAGSVVSELELPAQFAGLIDAQKKIMAYEAAHNYVFETPVARVSSAPLFLP
jgi:Asp-tRNA(Asn)/Glu-tRNA(Gln) amidotransferase A subunit family amidase